MEFIIATNNPGKLKDFNKIFENIGHHAISLKEAGICADPDETGKTFAENAYIKARAIYDIAKAPVIADDSGLAVDALNGEPGVYSARYGGGNLSDREKCLLLLENMKNVPEKDRGAAFKCALCAIISDDEIYEAEGEVRGTILYELKGENGFGYDPLFCVSEYNKTFGELSLEEKNCISHRFRAIRALADKLNK